MMASNKASRRTYQECHIVSVPSGKKEREKERRQKPSPNNILGVCLDLAGQGK